jgi:serine/threonine-protein kinase
LPFEHQSEYGLIHAHVQEQPTRPRDLAPTLPAAFERVILKAIEKEPERRYRTALEFRTALLRVGAISSRHITVTLPANAYGPVPPPQARHRSARGVLAGFALDLLLVAAVCGMLYALVLAPGQDVTSASESAAVVPTKVSAPPLPKPVHVRGKSAPAANPKSAARTRANDPYQSLRKAWSD